MVTSVIRDMRRVERVGGDAQALDVEPPPAEQTGDARQHSELVFHEDGERMLWFRQSRTAGTF